MSASCLLMVAGVALFYLGLATEKSVAAAGVATLLGGISIAVYALLSASPSKQRIRIGATQPQPARRSYPDGWG